MAQIKRSLRYKYLSVFAVIFLCWSPYCQGFILSQQDQQHIWQTQSLQNIKLSPLSPTTTFLTADNFATFFTNKTRSISSQFSAPHMQELKPTTSAAKTPLFAFCPFTEEEVSKLLLSSHPTTCPNPLTPSPSNLSFTLTSTHTHHQHISPHRHLPKCIQAGSGNPTAQRKLH